MQLFCGSSKIVRFSGKISISIVDFAGKSAIELSVFQKTAHDRVIYVQFYLQEELQPEALMRKIPAFSRFLNIQVKLSLHKAEFRPTIPQRAIFL